MRLVVLFLAVFLLDLVGLGPVRLVARCRDGSAYLYRCLVKIGEELVVFFLSKRIVFMIMTLCTFSVSPSQTVEVVLMRSTMYSTRYSSAIAPFIRCPMITIEP